MVAHGKAGGGAAEGRVVCFSVEREREAQAGMFAEGTGSCSKQQVCLFWEGKKEAGVV